MKFQQIKIFAVVLGVVLFCAAQTFAETGEAKKRELPKRGSLSSSGSLSAGGGTSVDSPWGSDEVSGGSPITGSVSKMADNKWRMKLFNNSKETYSVDVSVIQLGANQKAVKRDRYSYTLRGGQSTERDVSASSNTVLAELNLEGWKKVGGAKEKSSDKVAQNAQGNTTQNAGGN